MENLDLTHVASAQRLADAVPAWPTDFDPKRSHVVGVLTGEGIGREVVPAALEVLRTLGRHTSRRFEIRTGGPIGIDAQKISGKSLTDEVMEFCGAVFRDQGAVFCGPGGGRFVYDLRAHFDLYCKFTPLKPLPALRDAGVLRPEHLGGIDIVAVRENTGGLYFGEWGRREGDSAVAFQRFSYRAEEVERILGVAHRLARSRRRRLCVTVKPSGVPAISQLWEERVRHLNREQDVEVRLLEIDNAAYQLIANARQFDVVVSPNMFGDVLADCGALLLGSRGMSFSGNFGDGGRAVYQTGHGAAHDIAGTDSANPIGQIQALAMMLRESFDWAAGAEAIEKAVETTLAQGYRTPDIAVPGCRVVGTRELAGLVCRAVEESAATLSARA
jgi:3-isopropylmalate dehydrogenase